MNLVDALQKSLLVSILLHGALLASLCAVGGLSPKPELSIVVDLSLSSARLPGSGIGKAVAGPPALKSYGRQYSNPEKARPAPASEPPKPPVVAAQALKTLVERTSTATNLFQPKAEAIAFSKKVETGSPDAVSRTGGFSGQGNSGFSAGGGGTSGNPSAGGGSPKGSPGSGGTMAEQLRGRYLNDHFAYIKEMIQKNISYPPRARKMGWTGRVVVSFVIHENGWVSNENVVASSGFDLLDNNVIATIREVAPFPRPPVKAELRVPIIYRLD